MFQLLRRRPLQMNEVAWETTATERAVGILNSSTYQKERTNALKSSEI
jgi:hypothetical protein